MDSNGLKTHCRRMNELFDDTRCIVSECNVFMLLLVVLLMNCFCSATCSAQRDGLDFAHQEFIEPIDNSTFNGLPKVLVDSARIVGEFCYFDTPLMFDSAICWNSINVKGAVFDSSVSFISTTFKSLATFNFVDFNSHAKFTFANFGSSVGFEFADFHHNVGFKYAKFGSMTSFFHADFYSFADFLGVKFNSGVNFGGADFISDANFGLAQFDSSAVYYGVEFGSIADFDLAKFKAAAVFDECNFSSKSRFEFVEFHNKASFRNAIFKSDVSFAHAEFAGYTDFRQAVFNGRVSLYNSRLPDTLDLSHVKNIEGELDLSYATKFRGTCYINLLGTEIPRVRLRYSNFRLLFPDSMPNHRDELNVSFEDKCNVYEQLLKNFANNGYTDSYEKLDIEYHQMRYAEKWYWHLDLIQKFWWNYGYSKWYIFLWIPGILGVFTWFNAKMIWRLNNETYTIRPLESLRRFQNLSGWSKRFLFALVYTGFIFFGVKIDPDGIQKVDGWLYYIFFIYIVGLICLGYLANYIIAT